MAERAEDGPVPILTALEYLFVTLARGCAVGGPYWRTPPEGYTEVRWLTKKQTYRFTIDLMPPEPFPKTDPRG